MIENGQYLFNSAWHALHYYFANRPLAAGCGAINYERKIVRPDRWQRRGQGLEEFRAKVFAVSPYIKLLERERPLALAAIGRLCAGNRSGAELARELRRELQAEKRDAKDKLLQLVDSAISWLAEVMLERGAEGAGPPLIHEAVVRRRLRGRDVRICVQCEWFADEKEMWCEASHGRGDSILRVEHPKPLMAVDLLCRRLRHG